MRGQVGDLVWAKDELEVFAVFGVISWVPDHAGEKRTSVQLSRDLHREFLNRRVTRDGGSRPRCGNVQFVVHWIETTFGHRLAEREFATGVPVTAGR